MDNIKDFHSIEELENFLQSIMDKSRISEALKKILSYPSGTIISFVCRQRDPSLGHRQQSIRVFHNRDK